MVFESLPGRPPGGGANRRQSRRFTVSEWDGAPVEELTGDDHRVDGEAPRRASTDTDSTSGTPPGGDDASPAPPQMDLGSIYDAVRQRKDARHAAADRPDVGRGDENDSWAPSSSDGAHAEVSAPAAQRPHQRSHRHHHAARRPSTARMLSFARSGSHAEARKDDLTVAPSSSASRTSFASSSGSNIWTRLLGGGDAEGLWDGLNSKGASPFADREPDEEDEEEYEGCGDALKRCGTAWWYEVRHFCEVFVGNPRIWIASLAAFGVLCGVGMAAVNGERDAYVQKQKMTAEFVARETAQWFADEFRRAMIPLYAVQQGVVHSGYFDDLARQIGDYPNLLIPPEDPATAKMLMRNVTGICDNPDLQNKWRDIVRPVNEENDLDGAVFAYRLAPKNVFCLWEHDGPADAPDKNYGFDAGMSSNNFFWKSTTEAMFLKRGYRIFGPFGLPDKEWFCGHIPIWKNEESLNLHGAEVKGAWGFVMNFVDWRLLKDRSDIYERFAGCNLEFKLVRKDGAWIEGKDSAVLAESPNADELDEGNSVLVETESLHGVWQNRVGSLSGWGPPWYSTAVAFVVLGSLLLAFLVASALVERALHRDLVRRMLPKKAIAKIQRGQTVVERYNLVTIFFSDIVGFTSMAGAMRPIQVMKMLNELYTELDIICARHKVYKVETIGDAYMVVGGAPDRVPAPLAAERVARFAVDALDFVRDFRTKDGDRVFIRAGLASGPAVAGVVGTAMPRYCFFGDTVNFASRMESTSKKMKVQCAEITYRLLMDAPGADFVTTKRMEGDVAGVQIKGKGHHITYWIEKYTQRRAGKVAKAIDSGSSVERLPKVSEAEEVLEVVAEEGNVPPPSKASDAGSEGYEEFLRFMNSGDDQDRKPDLNMYTADEIHAAMAAQDWGALGHAESALVAASDDRNAAVARASALLEHHLLRVLRERAGDSEVALPLPVQDQCRDFVEAVAATYNGAKFHSLSHAMHVTTSMNRLLEDVKTEEPLNSFSLVFAALLHDAGHTGMSNKILKDTHHPLAEKYEDEVPIAEKHSIDIALELLFRPQYEAFRLAILPNETSKIEFAKTLFQGILVTDIATPERNKLCKRRYEDSQDEKDEYDGNLCPLVRHIGDVFDGVGLEESVKEEYPEEFVITHRGLQKCVRNEHLMLLSDVSHLVQGWENFVKWNFRLYKELNECSRKGLCDDPREGWFQGQIGFLEHYILPLATRSQVYFNEGFANALVANGRSNLDLWKKHGAEATVIMVNAAEDGEDECSVLMRLYELPCIDDV